MAKQRESFCLMIYTGILDFYDLVVKKKAQTDAKDQKSRHKIPTLLLKWCQTRHTEESTRVRRSKQN